MSDSRFFINNVNTDIYVGTGAGTKLIRDIENTEKSIKVISPYLSPSYIEKLISLRNTGIEVSLITTDLLEDFSDNRNLYKLIKQNRITIEPAKAKRDFLIKLKNWMMIFASVIPIIFLADLILDHTPKIAYLFLFTTLYCLSIWFLHSKISKLKIYNYSYQTLFPIKIFLAPSQKDHFNHSTFFIHSKIYVIDDKIAYMGSLNFTKSGFETNFENRFRFTDKNVIQGINEMYSDLLISSENSSLEIEQLARRIYREPIN